MTRTDKQMMGDLSECWVNEWLNSLGKDSKLAASRWDSKKDGICDGKPFEVKSGSLYVNEQAFGVGKDQLPKLRGVNDIFFMLTRPHKKWSAPRFSNYPELGNVYHCTPDFKWYDNPNWKIRNGILIPVYQKAWTFAFKLTPARIDEISQYAPLYG